MKLSDIISEVSFTPYRTVIQVVTNGESSSNVAELIRALPGVTTVTILNHDDNRNVVTYKVKIITQKPGEEAFESLKNNALSKYSEIHTFKYAPKQIERMKTPGEY